MSRQREPQDLYDAGRSDGIEEAKRALIDVAKLDFSQGSGVQSIVCLVLQAAMSRIAALNAAGVKP